MSSLMAINNHLHTSSLIIKLQQLLDSSPSTPLTLQWVKAHNNNEGNEAADRLAKEAVNNPNTFHTQIPAPMSKLKSTLLCRGLYRWQQDWQNGDTGRRT
ncbi:hypothetical protein X975_16605, partial [Stegodyphus mimosarum]